jgi:hypothetical protein
VHSAYIYGHYAYITDDATGSLRVIDFNDPRNPKKLRDGKPMAHL